MGSLVTETPFSEVTATLEILDKYGVTRADLANFRRASDLEHQEVARVIKFQREVVDKPSSDAPQYAKVFSDGSVILPDGSKIRSDGRKINADGWTHPNSQAVSGAPQPRGFFERLFLGDMTGAF